MKKLPTNFNLLLTFVIFSSVACTPNFPQSTGQVEVADLGPLAYIKAKQRNSDLEPIVAHIEKTTGRPW